MGVMHAYRKDERKQNSIIYGAASDGLAFRFCRIDNQGHWSQKPANGMGDGGQGQDILAIRMVNQDGGIVITIHLPHQEHQAQNEGPCVLWQPREYPGMLSSSLDLFPPPPPYSLVPSPCYY